MMRRRDGKHLLTAILAAGIYCVPGSIAHAQEQFLNSFVNPGEKMTLSSKRLPDGTVGTLNTVAGTNGSFQRFEGEGIIVLESPRLNLRCNKLLYDGETGVLTATGNVDLTQEGVAAKCQDLYYNTANKEIRLRGEPVVDQATETNNAHFEGMDEFTIHRMEDNTSEIEMSGGDDIQCQVVPKGQQTDAANAAAGIVATPTPTPSPTPTAAGTTAAPADAGFAGLGNNVKISTKEKDAKTPPNVFVSTDATGAFSMLRAYGLVQVDSDTMNLRSESLEYDKKKDLLEALYNVYVHQVDIEATAGRMLYELTSGKITLTINPEVKQTKPDGVLNITQMDSFVMAKNPDGTTTTQAVGGPDGSPKYEYQAAAVTPTVTPAAGTSVELDPNDPAAIEQIGRLEKSKDEKKSGTSPKAARTPGPR